MTQSDQLAPLPAFAPERPATTAWSFLDLVAPGAVEVCRKTLQAQIGSHVAPSVAFFVLPDGTAA